MSGGQLLHVVDFAACREPSIKGVAVPACDAYLSHVLRSGFLLCAPSRGQQRRHNNPKQLPGPPGCEVLDEHLSISKTRPERFDTQDSTSDRQVPWSPGRAERPRRVARSP